MVIALVFLTSYLVGSFPTSYVLGKVLKGIDIRDFGSGNVGATNTFRALGPGPGILVLLIDIAKGLIPVSLITPCIVSHFPAGVDITSLKILSGMSAIAGHNWTVFLRFRGGKGVATSVGVLLGIAPKALGLSAVVWIIVAGSSRYVSLASIVSAVSLPVFMWLSGQDRAALAFGAAVAMLIVIRHHANIVRLIQHKENKIGGPR
jgi:glycerol-3-phosphate acyltransferase PlsY